MSAFQFLCLPTISPVISLFENVFRCMHYHCIIFACSSSPTPGSAINQWHRVSNTTVELPLTFQEFLDSCNLLAAPIPLNILETYISGRGDKQSIPAIAEIASSTPGTSAGGRKALNQLKHLSTKKNERPLFLSLKFDEERLKDAVVTNICNRWYLASSRVGLGLGVGLGLEGVC